jgi:hypothetical protein
LLPDPVSAADSDDLDAPRPVEGVVSSEVLEELIVYSPGTSQVVSLNVSARAIWELCDGTRTVADICSELAGLTGVPARDLRPDVRGAIDKLHDLGMIARERK